jgi:hypothetical protein
MNPRFARLLLSLACALLCAATPVARTEPAFVRVSPRDSRYFELSDGRPYIPIGLNLIHPNTRDGEGLARMEEWMAQLGTHRGNFARIWLSSPFWDIEHERSGIYDEQKAKRIDFLMNTARRHGIRLKLTLEHFREMSDNPRQRWANKPLHLIAHGGPAHDMADFFSGSASRERFKQKLDWFSRRYLDDPIIFGWELWNEINAVRAGPDHFMPWTEIMLAELRQRFPHTLVMQSLGSFDTASVRDLYRRHSIMPGNDVAQVHRYLDLGARLELCHGPIDVLAADAVRELAAYRPARPILLAEAGAVEPGHSGPFKLYSKDKQGIILHDVLFAPFFAGAAGPGQIWHWDVYVDRNDLWHHYARFAEVVHDLDPPAEHFQPVTITHPRLRFYVLKGQSTVLLWGRDSRNTWRTELEQEQPAEPIHDLKLDVSEYLDQRAISRARAYDPWENRWTELHPQTTNLVIPTFARSVVVRFDLRSTIVPTSAGMETGQGSPEVEARTTPSEPASPVNGCKAPVL